MQTNMQTNFDKIKHLCYNMRNMRGGIVMNFENILDPELNLIKNDEFYLFYEMMIQSLKTDDVKEGIGESLNLLKSYMESESIGLYIKDDNGNFVLKESACSTPYFVNFIGCIINKAYPLIKQRKILGLDLNLSENLENVTLLDVPVEEGCCVLSIVNKKINVESLFWDRLYETMQVILKRALSYERNTKAITIDLLTGLDNRNSYEKRLESLKNEDNALVFGIFDLFRLKYINDNYSHDKGDIYIKKTAEILRKYWPKQKKTIDSNCIEKNISTGHCIYRIGGDEFVLMTESDDLQLAAIKADLVKAESELVMLGTNNDDDLHVGLNCGLVFHEPKTSIKETIEKADELMQEDKRKMYKKYNLDRRR